MTNNPNNAAFLLIMQYEEFGTLPGHVKDTLIKYGDMSYDYMEEQYDSFIKHRGQYGYILELVNGDIDKLALYRYAYSSENKLMKFLIELREDDNFEYIDEYHHKMATVIAKRLVDSAYEKRTGQHYDDYLETYERKLENAHLTLYNPDQEHKTTSTS